jgi:signal peptidase II
MTVAAGRRVGIGLTLAALVVAMDQLSKAMVLNDWPQAALQRVPVLPWLDLSLSWNRGISFSLGNQLGSYDRLLFAGLAVVVSVLLVLWMAKGASPLVLVALGLVTGGALGNAIDRLRFGAVEDFIYVHIGAFDWWPIFNGADSMICLGAGLMVVDSLFDRPLSHKNTP